MIFKHEKTSETEQRRGALTGAFIIAVMVIVLDALFVVLPKKEFSENENRYLEKVPAVSFERLKSGALMEDINSYLCDHFPFRDAFMSVRTGMEMAEGRREINGIYIADDGYLIEPYNRPENTEKIISAWSGFAGKLPDSVDLKLMLVPTAVWTYRDKLPANAPWLDQQATAEYIESAVGIDSVDAFSALGKKGVRHQISQTAKSMSDTDFAELADSADSDDSTDSLYYRSDHHWTTAGAYVGYCAYCESTGLDPVPLSEWTAETVTTDFHGTIYSKVNDYSMPGDSIVSYSYPGDTLSVVYEDTHEESNSLYNPEYLKMKDKYSYFLDNLHSLITITNENAETDRELAVIKDSYANSMIPFLTHHFKKIYVFDTRSYKAGPSAFIGEHKDITDVLILYNMNTLDKDLGIGGTF